MRRTFGLDSLDFLNFSSAVLRRWVTEALAAEVGGRRVRQGKGRMP